MQIKTSSSSSTFALYILKNMVSHAGEGTQNKVLSVTLRGKDGVKRKLRKMNGDVVYSLK
jgi:hypothetical protein